MDNLGKCGRGYNVLLLVPCALRRYLKQPFDLQYMTLAIPLAVVGAVSA